MSLQIVSILDAGKPNLERLLLEAVAPLNLSFYVMLYSTVVGEGVSSGGHPSYWFPALSLIAGEKIQLFTGHLLDPKNTSPAGRAFFWGLNQTIFNSPADCAVLVQAATWRTARVELMQVSPPPPPPTSLGSMFDFKGKPLV